MLRLLAIVLIGALTASPALAQRWVTAWAASVQGPYPIGNKTAQPELRFALPSQETGAKDQTFRLVVKPELWGAADAGAAEQRVRGAGGGVRRGVRGLAVQRGGADAAVEPAGVVRRQAEHHGATRRAGVVGCGDPAWVSNPGAPECSGGSWRSACTWWGRPGRRPGTRRRCRRATSRRRGRARWGSSRMRALIPTARPAGIFLDAVDLQMAAGDGHAAGHLLWR